MMLYGREMETPLDLVIQHSCDGVEEPGVPYLETLTASLQEAYDHARATLDHSHKRQKHYYDLRQRQVNFAVGDLVRAKSHPRSDVQSNFAAKLAPLFTGLFWISQKLVSVNYRLAMQDTGGDGGVFHVVNLQPFHTWDSVSASRDTAAETAEQDDPGVLDNDCHDTWTDLPTGDMSCDAHGVADPLPRDCDSENHSLMTVSDTDPDCVGRYDLRPRHHPRVTSCLPDSRWTYHTKRLEVNSWVVKSPGLYVVRMCICVYININI